MNQTLFWKIFSNFLLALIILSQTSVFAQPNFQWEKDLGISGSYMSAFLETPDGGYIMAGESNAGVGGVKTQPSRGANDYWVVKLRPDRSVEWDGTYGGPDGDRLRVVVPTADGGYLLGGNSFSDKGFEKSEDNHSVRDNEGALPPDYWIVKISSNGTKQWDKTYGGLTEDFFNSLKPTPDGGFILGGRTRGAYNIMKLNVNGELEWEKDYRGQNGFNSLNSVIATSDKGYIIVGASAAGIGNDKTQGVRGYSDYWIIKTDSFGTVQWDKTFGGSEDDEATDVNQTADGGYIVCGYTESPLSGDKTENQRGYYDTWILKLNADGTLAWQKTLGGSMYLVTEYENTYYDGNSFLHFLEERPNGDIVFAGSSNGKSSQDKTSDLFGAWMVTLNQSGKYVADTLLQYNASTFRKTQDGGFLLGTSYRILKFTDSTPPLPVTLTSFTAEKEKTSTVLTWSTSSETQSDYFELQHSLTGKSWNTIATVEPNGDVNKTANYMLIDNKPALGVNNLYRLKMIDTDGSFTYSKIESLYFDSDITLNVFPNPAAETLRIEIANWQNVNSVELLNSRSDVVYHSDEKPTQNVDIRELPTGLYFVRITLVNEGTSVRKVLINQSNH